eukprot:gene68400-93738_t
MFGLAEQIHRDPAWIGQAIADDDDFARTGNGVDADSAEHQALGRGDIGIAGTDDLVDSRNRCGAVSQSGDRLRAADREHPIDAGKMGGAMLTGWLARGLDPKSVVVIDPYLSPEIKALAAKGARLNPDAKDVGAVAALVVAVKPQMFAEVGPTLRAIAGSSLVVSIMAGSTIAGITATCGGKVVRAMPNTPAAIGRGITVAVAAQD